MKLSLAPPWVLTSRDPLVLTSETSHLSVDIAPHLSPRVCELLLGWVSGAEPALEPLRDALRTRGVIRPEALAVSPELARQVEYWRAFTEKAGDAVERLQGARVAIAGVGGIGGAALQHLVAAGVSSFRLLDADTVEPSNLNRQFIFSADSVGRTKVAEAKHYVTLRRADANVEALAEMWDPESSDQSAFLFSEVDLVLAAIDRPSVDSSLHILEHGWAAGIPVILAMVGLDRSLVSQVFDKLRSARAPRESLLIARHQSRAPFLASHGPSNSVCAAVAADQIVHHIAGLTNRVEYDRPLIIERSVDGAVNSRRVDSARL